MRDRLVNWLYFICSKYIYSIEQQFWILDLRSLNQPFHEVYYDYTLQNSGWIFHSKYL